MRSLLAAVLACSLFASPAVYAKGSRGSSRSARSKTTKRSTPKSTTSKKSHVAGSNDGHYQGGVGSSHKGGTYKNPTTGNKERDRKGGTPQ